MYSVINFIWSRTYSFEFVGLYVFVIEPMHILILGKSTPAKTALIVPIVHSTFSLNVIYVKNFEKLTILGPFDSA